MSQSEHTTFTLDDILDQIGAIADLVAALDPDALDATVKAFLAIQGSGDLPEELTAEDIALTIRLVKATEIYAATIQHLNARMGASLADKTRGAEQ